MSSQAAAPAIKDTLDEFVDLMRQKREIEAALRKVKTKISGVQPGLLDWFAETGLQKIGHEGTGATVYIRRQVRVKNMGEDRAAACAALKTAGLGDYVAESFNLNSLSAYFREQVTELNDKGDPVTDPNVVLPDPLRGVIELVDEHDVRMTN